MRAKRSSGANGLTDTTSNAGAVADWLNALSDESANRSEMILMFSAYLFNPTICCLTTGDNPSRGASIPFLHASARRASPQRMGRRGRVCVKCALERTLQVS
jgi:hypothetical protein